MKSLYHARLKAFGWASVLIGLAALFLAAERFAGIDPHAHRLTLERLNELDRLNSEINEFVLTVPNEIFHDFDPLVAAQQQIRIHMRALGRGPDAIAARSEDIARSLASLTEALDHRVRLTERFTSDSAVLRNSVYYIPLAVEIVADHADTPADVRVRLNSLLHAILRARILGVTDEARNDITALLGQLEGPADEYPEPVAFHLQILIRHVQNMLDYQRRVDALTTQITAHETAAQIHELSSAYSRWVERQLQYSGGYRFALLLLALILLAQGVYTFLRLRDTVIRLDASEAKYRSTVAALAEGVMVWDENGQVTECNASAERILGLPAARLKGTMRADPSWQIISAEGTPLTRKDWPVSVVRRTGKPQFNTVIGIRKNAGPPTWLSVNAQPIRPTSGGNVAAGVVSFRDITQQRQAEERLAFMAHHDSLTGLANRLLFGRRVESAVQRAYDRGAVAAVLLIDLDNFKAINDSFGHMTGDLVLRSVAERLKQCTRGSDTVARMGGDEFVVLAEDIREPQDAEEIASKISQALRLPYMISGQQLFVTASIGVCCYPADGDDGQELLISADAAMYAVKRQGRNNFGCFSSEMKGGQQDDLTLANDLREALEHNQLCLHYQPIVSAEGGAIIGVEALVRWHHPERGAVSPTQLIRVAEEHGFIDAVGDWVMETACTQGRAWHEAGYAVRVAVNLSALQFRDSGLVGRVEGILEATGFDARWLELEVTESMMMFDRQRAADILKAFRRAGITVAVDDFGTGYSSLSYLKAFPVDRLKIDGSFMRDIPQASDDVAIVRAIITMGKSLSIRVTAEGIETTAQRAFLQTELCDEMQGYLFSRPASAADLEELLGQHAVRHSRELSS